jgi:hypothetical protein
MDKNDRKRENDKEQEMNTSKIKHVVHQRELRE